MSINPNYGMRKSTFETSGLKKIETPKVDNKLGSTEVKPITVKLDDSDGSEKLYTEHFVNHRGVWVNDTYDDEGHDGRHVIIFHHENGDEIYDFDNHTYSYNDIYIEGATDDSLGNTMRDRYGIDPDDMF